MKSCMRGNRDAPLRAQSQPAPVHAPSRHRGTLPCSTLPCGPQDCYAHPNFNSAVDRDSGFRTVSMICLPLQCAQLAARPLNTGCHH